MKERTDDNPKSASEVVERIWELAEKIDICMLTTWDGKNQRSRPMSARMRKSENAVYFLMDTASRKISEIEHFPTVSLAWADNGGHKYVVMAGEASVSNDRPMIAELWSDWDKAWWEDANDPTIRLLTVIPADGELWDSPNAIVSTTKMMISMVTGAAPEMGDNAKVKL